MARRPEGPEDSECNFGPIGLGPLGLFLPACVREMVQLILPLALMAIGRFWLMWGTGARYCPDTPAWMCRSYAHDGLMCLAGNNRRRTYDLCSPAAQGVFSGWQITKAEP